MIITAHWWNVEALEFSNMKWVWTRVRDSSMKWVGTNSPARQSLHDGEVKTIMKLANLSSIVQMEAFLAGNQAVAFSVAPARV